MSACTVLSLHCGQLQVFAHVASRIPTVPWQLMQTSSVFLAAPGTRGDCVRWRGCVTFMFRPTAPAVITRLCMKVLHATGISHTSGLSAAPPVSEWALRCQLELPEIEFLGRFRVSRPRKCCKVGKATQERSRSPGEIRVPTSRQVAQHDVEGALLSRPANRHAQGCGPRAALRKAALDTQTEGDKAEWLEAARIDAIIGSCSKSLPSVRSGVRAYIAFVSKCSAVQGS